MPKILQINVTANWGSTGKIAEQIGLCAQSHGWKSYIAFGRMANPSKNELVKIGNAFDVYEHYTEARLLDNEGLASRRATKRLLRRVNEIKPDIVHLHNIHDHYLNYPMLFRYLAEKKIPVVWTQHDQWATTGHCCYNLVGCERWKEECHDCPISEWYSIDRSRRNFRLKKQLMEDIPSLTIVPVSEWLGENVRQSHLKNRPIQVIHNGIDINTFSPQPTNAHDRYGIDKQKKIILGVAALWDARKGLNDFCELAKRLYAGKYAIVIVGQRTEDIKHTENGCQMVFVDRTQNALELAQLYSSAAVFVNPTYQDNYPTTNLEAIACGTPVITYRTGGSPEAVDENTGAVVEQGDIDGLVSAIERLANGDYKDACRKKAEREFDNSKCFNPYIKLYNKLLGGGKILVLGVSNIWSNAKGLTDFISLSKNPDFVVVLVGLKPKQVKMLNGESYKLCNIVPMCRTQNQQELAMIYSLADVSLSLSYYETFGLTVVESLSCGTPVIVYDNTGQANIPTISNGVKVETGNIQAVANSIRWLKSNPLSPADCRKRAEEGFDKDKCFEKYIELYNQILSKHEHKG